MENIVFQGKSGVFYRCSSEPSTDNSENFKQNYVEVEHDGITFKMDKLDEFGTSTLYKYIVYNGENYRFIDNENGAIPYNKTGKSAFENWFN